MEMSVRHLKNFLPPSPGDGDSGAPLVLEIQPAVRGGFEIDKLWGRGESEAEGGGDPG